jgi:hypothetical protein
MTKLATYIPRYQHLESAELAVVSLLHVNCKCGVPDSIPTDHVIAFSSGFRDRVCYNLSINHRLSTTFNPLRDSYTEQQTKTMLQYLRACCLCMQDNWVELLPLVELATNA